MKTKTTYDQAHDVLRVNRVDATPFASREHPLDADLILHLDRDRHIVGVQLLYTSRMQGIWGVHPARHCLPTEIRTEVDNFMAWLDAGPANPDACAARKVPPAWMLAAQS